MSVFHMHEDEHDDRGLKSCNQEGNYGVGVYTVKCAEIDSSY